MATIQHDAKRWGPARAAGIERARLVRVADLVEALARVDERATVDAARIVLDRLDGAALFELRTDGDAPQVDELWKHRPVTRFVVNLNDNADADGRRSHIGPAGAHQLMRLAWCEGGAARFNMAATERLAVLEALAAAAFPELDWPDASRPTGASADAACMSGGGPQVVQPEGGAWPHDERQPWTEAERIALFLMRHRDKRTGDELAAIAGVTRQRIDEVIGGVRRSNAGAKDGWAPSPELLAACGKALQPLQSAALAMTG